MCRQSIACCGQFGSVAFMSCLAKSWRVLLAVGLGAFLGGCTETFDSSMDEQKESNFIQGKNLLTKNDYPAAVEAFEKALEVNPHNAQAHLELFLLYEQNMRDYAAAIYHGSRFRKMRPKSPYAEVVQQRMDNCKQELAKDLPIGPVTPYLQRELEKLKVENGSLQQQVQVLAQQLSIATNRVRVVTNVVTNVVYAPAPTPAPANPVTPPANAGNSSIAATPKTTPVKDTVLKGQVGNATTPKLGIPIVERPPYQTHIIKKGDTLATIARQYGVSVAAIQTANPTVDARRIKPGQMLKIPVK